MVTRHQRISADRQGLFLGDIEKCAIVADAQFDIKTRTSYTVKITGNQENSPHAIRYASAGKKEKAGDHGTVFRESTGLDITFC